MPGLSTPIVAALWALNDVTVGGDGFCEDVDRTRCDALTTGTPNTIGAGVLDCAWVGTTSRAARPRHVWAHAGT